MLWRSTLLAVALVLGSLSTASAQYYYGGGYGYRWAPPARAWGGPPLVNRRVYLPRYGYSGYYGYRSNWMSRASQSRDGGW